MRDGDIDYSMYTLHDIEESLTTIDREKYPKNYANLSAAYQALTAADGDSAGKALVHTERDGRNVAGSSASWLTRAVAALSGAYFLWWANSLFMHADSCPNRHKLVARIVGEICERFGNTAGAVALLSLGILMLAYAANPSRHSG